jgi:hypothetical protein
MGRFFGRVVFAVLVALPVLGGVHPVPVGAAAVVRWEHVFGDADPQGWSRYDVVSLAGDGSVYLAGEFAGSFSGVTAPGAGYFYFLQKLDAAGAVQWTQMVSSVALGHGPDAPNLAVDGLGNPYLRFCVPACTLAVYDQATGEEVEAISDAGIQNEQPLLGVGSGGVIVVDLVYGAPTTLAARRLNSALGTEWSFDLTGKLETNSARAWLVGGSNGSFWAIGTKPGDDNVMPMVHISATGGDLGTVAHSGGSPFDEAWIPSAGTGGPVAVGPGGHLWIDVDPPGDGFDRQPTSFSPTDGSRVGPIDLTLPHEQVVTASGLVSCDNYDLEVLFGGLLSGSGALPRFRTRVFGSRLITVMQCNPLGGGPPLSMMVVFSTASPVGGGYVREAAIPFPASATVHDMATDASGALAVAGTTSGPDQFLQSPVMSPSNPTASMRAAVAYNPTGNLLDQDEFTALAPVRLFDTRPNEPQGLIHVIKNRIGAGEQLKIHLTGFGGVPSNGVGAVSLNVTVTNPAAAGFITAHPCGTRPLASNLNYVPDQTVANAVIAPVSATGEVCFYSHVATDLLADVNGWFRSGSGFQPLPPVRIFDSRPGEPDGAVQITKQRYGGAAVITVRVGDVAGVPASASAVSLNVTATEPIGNGFVTVYPCGDRPLASNLNYIAGQTVPNAVIAPLGNDSVLCFYAHADTHLIADINGYFGASAGFHPVTPTRTYDTRVGEPDGAVAVTKHKYGGTELLTVTMTGVAGVPSTGVGAVSLNVTATNPNGPGYVTVFPCGERPLASNINFTAGATVPNAVLTPVSARGEVCFYAHADTDLIADVNGWFPA